MGVRECLRVLYRYAYVSDARVSDAYVSDARVSDAYVSDARVSDAYVSEMCCHISFFLSLFIFLSLSRSLALSLSRSLALSLSRSLALSLNKGTGIPRKVYRDTKKGLRAERRTKPSAYAVASLTAPVSHHHIT